MYYCKAEVCMVYKVSVLHIKNYDCIQKVYQKNNLCLLDITIKEMYIKQS